MRSAKPQNPAPRSGSAPHNSPPAEFARNVLVPIDFSEASVRALDTALALFGGPQHSMRLLHVVEQTPFLSGLDALPIAISDDEAASCCRGELEQLAREHPGAGGAILSEVRIGNPAKQIIEAARANQSDLIVLPTHGRTGLKHLLLGSTAEKVVREAPCPVLVLRAGEGRADSVAPPRKILAPIDFSPESGEALRYAGAFAARVSGRITVLHCAPVPARESILSSAPEIEANMEARRRAAERELMKYADAFLPPGALESAVALVAPPLEGIPNFAHAGGFDLIVCATHGMTGIKQTFLGSTAEGIVRHAPCPVLVVRQPRSVKGRREAQSPSRTRKHAPAPAPRNASPQA